MVAAKVTQEKRVISGEELNIVRDAIQQQYGFIPPDIYIIDLINFVQAVVEGQGELPALATVAQAHLKKGGQIAGSKPAGATHRHYRGG